MGSFVKYLKALALPFIVATVGEDEDVAESDSEVNETTARSKRRKVHRQTSTADVSQTSTNNVESLAISAISDKLLFNKYRTSTVENLTMQETDRIECVLCFAPVSETHPNKALGTDFRYCMKCYMLLLDQKEEVNKLLEKAETSQIRKKIISCCPGIPIMRSPPADVTCNRCGKRGRCVARCSICGVAACADKKYDYKTVKPKEKGGNTQGDKLIDFTDNGHDSYAPHIYEVGNHTFSNTCFMELHHKGRLNFLYNFRSSILLGFDGSSSSSAKSNATPNKKLSKAA